MDSDRRQGRDTALAAGRCGDLYRDIRLEALKLAPEAFSSTFAREDAKPPEWFAARLDDAAVFGAFAER